MCRHEEGAFLDGLRAAGEANQARGEPRDGLFRTRKRVKPKLPMSMLDQKGHF